MKLIVGLGNPGLKYKHTRHNIGFLAVDDLAKINNLKINKKGFSSLFNKMYLHGDEALLLKPQTFMNNSGEAVKDAVERFGIDLSDILVVCDDINLELGILRFRAMGSSGGHKGLGSIIERLGSKDFNRLRVGIGSKRAGILKDYVLSGFRADEKRRLKEIIRAATDAIGIWAKEGIDTAMNVFNEKNPA